jgi:glutaminase
MPARSWVADVVLAGHQPREAIGHILHFVRFLANDNAIAIDPAVARSETECGYRNRALANYMRAFGNLLHPVDLVLGVYDHTAIEARLGTIARMPPPTPLLLGNPTWNAKSPDALYWPQVSISALMRRARAAETTLAFEPGMRPWLARNSPARANWQQFMAIAQWWKPGLSDQGNSLVGTYVLERLASTAGRSIF